MKRWLLKAMGVLGVSLAVFLALQHQYADGDAAATLPMSSNAQYDLNHMNTPASKWRMGYLIADALNPSGNQTLANGTVLIGNGSNVGTAVTLSGALTTTNAGVTSLNSNIFQEVSGTLTQAQLQQITTGPAVLVATPAAGSVLIPIELQLQHVYSTAQYTSGANLIMQYQVGSVALMNIYGTVVTGASTAVYYMRPSVFDLGTGTTTGDGLSINSVSGSAITITSPTAYASGNAANVVNYRLKYRTVPIP